MTYTILIAVAEYHLEVARAAAGDGTDNARRYAARANVEATRAYRDHAQSAAGRARAHAVIEASRQFTTV